MISQEEYLHYLLALLNDPMIPLEASEKDTETIEFLKWYNDPKRNNN